MLQTTSPAILLITLGTSQAIVPEAFLLDGLRFKEVHVLTTETPEVGLIVEFFARHAPETRLTISRVANSVSFQSEVDHFRIEDVLHRWILSTAPDPRTRYFCISGGFKTMSAATMKAAEWFGAAEVFHVLAEDCCLRESGRLEPPKSIEEILRARAENRLHYVRLGAEHGWPQVRALVSSQYPLEVIHDAGGIIRLRSPDGRLRERLQEILRQVRQISGSWSEMDELPFTELATWPSEQLAWLRQSVCSDEPADQNWIASIPKVELHCHLGGFATSGVELELVRSAAQQPDLLPPIQEILLPQGWPNVPIPTESKERLKDYMKLGDNNGSTLLRDPGCLERQCQNLFKHLQKQCVIYAEIRCSPANYATANRSPWDVLCQIRQTFKNCMRMARENGEFECHVNLIIIATRREEGDFRVAISRHLALAVSAAEHWNGVEDCRVVGVDLAGFENRATRAHYFREEFTGVNRCGLALTVHAGENDDAEGIWSAVFDLNARRLGHALTLAQSPELLRSVVDRRIGVEMCPYANMQIRSYICGDSPTKGMMEYPLLKYLREGVCVTVNTDNIGISSASLSENLLLAARLCPGLTRIEILKLQRNALDCAFLQPQQRARLVSRYSQHLHLP